MARNKNTCPYCRTSIEPDQRYVEDHTITELRKSMITVGAGIVEHMFPDHTAGFTRYAVRNLHNMSREQAILAGISMYRMYLLEGPRREGKPVDEYIIEMCDNFKERLSKSES